MRILILSFYYSPDLSAGSFRTAALVDALLEKLPADAHIDLITTLPNRYNSFTADAPELEEQPRLTVHRIKLPDHKSGMVDQSKAFFRYAKTVLMLTRCRDYQMVYGTSSRLMTAALSVFICRRKALPLYLDIRDIFVDTISDVLPQKTAFVVKPFFSLVERLTITQADHVNLVSKGFSSYFLKRYPHQTYSYFTNGIDSEFIAAQNSVDDVVHKERPLSVLYAGNMGEGQGLHTIIPALAKKFQGRLVFRLLGDGGRKPQLQQRLSELECANVELLPPVNRTQLIEEYHQADILFLHLNNYSAFRKVLPSKLFEYAAMGKPIWAGVAGCAAEFVNEEITNAAVFEPCNVDEAEQVFESLILETQRRTSFIEKFSRKNIMNQMAESIIECQKGRG